MWTGLLDSRAFDVSIVRTLNGTACTVVGLPMPLLQGLSGYSGMCVYSRPEVSSSLMKETTLNPSSECDGRFLDDA